MHQDTPTFFREGLVQWMVNTDAASAKDNFDWITGSLDPDQCDVYLAEAMLGLEHDNNDRLVEQAYRTVGTCGQLREAIGLTGTPFSGKVDIQFMKIRRGLSSKTDICIAYGMLALKRKQYGEAIDALRNAKPFIPAVGLLEGVVYMKAGRWDDVIQSVQPCLNANIVDAETGQEIHPPQPDQFVQRAGYLLLGIAYAHLGNTEVALGHLSAACAAVIITDTGERRPGYRSVVSTAKYWAGLVERNQGNEQEAQSLFNAGIQSEQTDELVSAISDPSIRLRVTSSEMINQRTDYWDISTEPDLAEVIAADDSEKRRAMLAEAESELNRQIGMENVKNQVRRMKSSLIVSRERELRGEASKQQASRHLIFTGPPGTGKTTIARVVGLIYAGLGIIRKSHIEETSRNDFVGMYQGHSTAKTVETVERALDGILFIDEAYNLVTSKEGGGGTDTFGVEAVGELLRLMENYRDRLIVIIAGYANDIDRFLDTNEGLASRFKNRIDFGSYSPEEIAEIAEVVAEDRVLDIDPEARELIVNTGLILMDTDHRNRRLIDRAGNGRFARNLIEAAEDYKNERLVSSGVDISTLTNEELSTITAVDVKNAVDTLVSPILNDSRDMSARR